jgi:hypothetical protein
MQLVRGLLRIFAVGVTVVSLMLVAAVAVAASSGRAGSSNAITNSVGAVFAPLVSGHSAQAGVQSGATTAAGNTGTTTAAGNGTTTDASKGAGEGDGNNGVGTGCKPPKKHHTHATGGHKNHPCDDGRDDGSD